MRPEGAGEATDLLQGAGQEQGTPAVRHLLRSSSLEGSSWSEAEWRMNRVRSISPNTDESFGNTLATTASSSMQGWFIDPETVMEEREMRRRVVSTNGEEEQQAGRRETRVGHSGSCFVAAL